MFQYLGIFVFSSSFVSFCRAATTEEYVSEASIYAALYPHLEGNIVSPIWICTSIQFLKIFASTDVKSTSHLPFNFLSTICFLFSERCQEAPQKKSLKLRRNPGNLLKRKLIRRQTRGEVQENPPKNQNLPPFSLGFNLYNLTERFPRILDFSLS